MKKAIWNGQVIAESDNTENIEGNLSVKPFCKNTRLFN